MKGKKPLHPFFETPGYAMYQRELGRLIESSREAVEAFRANGYASGSVALSDLSATLAQVRVLRWIRDELPAILTARWDGSYSAEDKKEGRQGGYAEDQAGEELAGEGKYLAKAEYLAPLGTAGP